MEERGNLLETSALAHGPVPPSPGALTARPAAFARSACGLSRYDRARPPGAAPRARTAGRPGPDTEDGLSALRCNTRADNVLAAAVDVGAGVDCALGPVSGTGVGAAGVGIEGSPCEAFVPFIQGAD